MADLTRLAAKERVLVRITVSLADLVERAQELAQRGERTVLGITGAPGAGKSTVSAALLDALGAQAGAAPMDGFHLSNEVLVDLGRRERKGAWDTFDVDGFVALLQRLRANIDEVVYAPVFDRWIETAIASGIAVPQQVPLVITEGNYLLHDSGGWERVRPELDEIWFIDVPAAERVRRLVGRRVGHGEAISDAKAWVHGVDQANADLVTPSAKRADLVITLVDEFAPATER